MFLYSVPLFAAHKESIMKTIQLVTVAIVLSAASPAFPSEVEQLASCATKVFNEIGRTQKWSGKAPAGCSANVRVQKNGEGLVISAWNQEMMDEGYVRTSFSAMESFEEIARPTERAAANREIMSRAKRLSRCLQLTGSYNIPAECRSRGSKEYLAGEETGVKDVQQIQLDDQGRYASVEYVISNTMDTPTEPDEPENNELPPGLLLRILPNGTPAR
jgi:hypothetical protein